MSGDNLDDEGAEDYAGEVELRDKDLLDYFKSFPFRAEGETDSLKFPRQTCCGTSRSLYCPQCYRLLIPRDDRRLPTTLIASDGKVSGDLSLLSLPFDLDIILHDRRASASGLHAKVLTQISRQDGVGKDHVSIINEIQNCCISEKGRGGQDQQSTMVRVVDYEAGEAMPNYTGPENKGTFLLFPSAGESKSINDVAKGIKKLVVLDCKWTRTSSRLHESLSELPKVHLGTSPDESYSWRWHNAGKGMVSTIEAIYYASWEMLQMKKVESDDANEAEKFAAQQRNMKQLLFFFGIQRAMSAAKASQQGNHAPFTKQGKEEKREQRRCIGTDKHAHDIEKGRQLKMKHRTQKT